MSKLRLNNKPAIKLFGKKIYTYHNNVRINCEGDKVWFPECYVEFINDNEILVEEWLYKAKVEKGEL